MKRHGKMCLSLSDIVEDLDKNSLGIGKADPLNLPVLVKAIESFVNNSMNSIRN